MPWDLPRKGDQVSPKVVDQIHRRRRCAGERPAPTVASMKAHASFAGLLAGRGLAVALAARRSGQGSQQPAAHPSANPAQLARQFAQCVRDHGDPSFRDPTIDAQGNPQLPDGVEKPPSDSAMMRDSHPTKQASRGPRDSHPTKQASRGPRDCGALLNQLQAQNRSNQAPDPAAMRAFAQCMRDHGISDWPDPDAEGYFHFLPELANFKASPPWPQIRAVWTGPCKRFNPQGHVWAAS